MTASALFINYISNVIFLDISINLSYFLNYYVWLDFLQSFVLAKEFKINILFYIVYDLLITNDTIISKVIIY